jgi:histidinol dehydrogenase
MGARWLKRKSEPSKGAAAPNDEVARIVRDVIDDIRQNGDVAVRRYSEKFDKWSPQAFKLSPDQITDIISSVPEQTIADIKQVQRNVRRFALAQRDALQEVEIEMEPGVFLGHKNVPIQTVGAYVL